MRHTRGLALSCLARVGWSSLVLWGLTTATGHAQDHPRFEAAGGMTLLHSREIVDGYARGLMLSGAWNTAEWLGLTVELSHSTRSRRVGFLDVRADFQTMVTGPVFTWRTGRLTPFGRALGGVTKILTKASVDVPPSESVFGQTHGTIQLGGGVDVPLASRLAARAIYDYRRILATETIVQHRFLVGAVVALD